MLKVKIALPFVRREGAGTGGGASFGEWEASGGLVLTGVVLT